MQERILFFDTQRGLNYWYDYICHYINERNIPVKARKYKKTIEIGAIKLFFRHISDEEDMLRGRKYYRAYYNFERELDCDFFKIFETFIRVED